MEQLVVLLVIGAISFINWLIRKSAERRAQRRLEAGAPARSPIGDADDEPAQWQSPPDDLRKFMEALGLPSEELPPAASPVESWQPPAAEVPPPLPVPITAPAVGFQPPKFTAPSEEVRRLARRLEMQGGTVKSTAIGESSRVRDMLSSPQGMRDAIILREILSPPKSMQSF